MTFVLTSVADQTVTAPAASPEDQMASPDVESWIAAMLETASEVATVLFGKSGAQRVETKPGLPPGTGGAYLALVGDQVNVQVGFSTDSTTAATLTRVLMGLDAIDLPTPEDTVDALNELANMIGTRTKGRMIQCDPSMKSGLPVFVPGDAPLVGYLDAHTTEVRFGSLVAYLVLIRRTALTPGRPSSIGDAGDAGRLLRGQRSWTILDSVSIPAMVLDKTGTITEVNSAWRRAWELDDASQFVAGAGYLDTAERTNGADHTAGLSTGLRAVLEGRLPQFVLEYRQDTISGVRWYQTVIDPLVDDTGAVVSSRDVTDLKRIAEALGRELKWSELLRALSLSFLTAKTTDIGPLIGAALESLAGVLQAARACFVLPNTEGTLRIAHAWSAEGGNLTDLFGSDLRPVFERITISGPAVLDAAELGGGTTDNALLSEGAVKVLVAPVSVGDGAGGWLCFSTGHRDVEWDDITTGHVEAASALVAQTMSYIEALGDRERLEDELRHQAFHDALTGLANRALFTDRVEHALARQQHTGDKVAIVLIDLDDFKTINDGLGHGAGDRLLVEVAGRLDASTRAGDTVARLGGDEFALLLEGTADGDLLAHRAEQIMERVTRTVQLGERALPITASAGIAVSTPGSVTADELTRHADVAMYMAKSQGKGRCVRYQSGMRLVAHDRLQLKTDLLRALTNNAELELYYQPVIDLASGRLDGVEALVRWNHPERGLLMPDQFLPLAEDTGMIVPLGRWVLNQACRQSRLWRDEQPSAARLKLSVNISARQLDDPAIVGDVATALAASGIHPGQLVLEMTEAVLTRKSESNFHVLNRLKQLGVSLAIDDFGTGYSTLAALQHFPIDTLKVDRCFAQGLEGDAKAAALSETIIKLGQTLNLRTIAEGIETPEQLERLRSMNCEFGQGFLFAKPLAKGGIDALLQGNGSPDSATPSETDTPSDTETPPD